MSWTPPKGPKDGPIQRARAKRERKWRRKLRRKKKTGLQKLRIINPRDSKARAKVGGSDWTRAEVESAILSIASRPTPMRKFRWLAYGQRKKNESLVVTLCRAHHIDTVAMWAVVKIALELRDRGHLTYSNRWGWRGP